MSNRMRQFTAVLAVVCATFVFASQVMGGAPSGKNLHRHSNQSAKSRRQSRNIEPARVVQLYGNHICPISLDKVDPKSFAAYKDQEDNINGRIYLCCDGCKERAEKNLPDLYQQVYRMDKKSGKQSEAWDVKNSICPVSGEPALIDVTSEYNGMRVHFHSPECAEVFLKNPEEGMSKILPKDKRFAYTPPTRLGMAHH